MHATLRSCCFPLLACLLLTLAAGARAQTPISIRGDEPDAVDDQLELALTRAGSIDCQEMPLKEFVELLVRQFDVPIILVHKKLEEASVSPDTPINIRLDHLRLEDILRIVLRSLELSFTIRNHVIAITTDEDVESQLTTRVYPVRDLISEPLQTNAYGLTDYDGLIELIATTLRPDSWDDVGGPGGIDCFPGAAALVVSQTRDVHQQIERLLAALRRAKTAQGLGPSFLSSSSSSSSLLPRSAPEHIPQRSAWIGHIWSGNSAPAAPYSAASLQAAPPGFRPAWQLPHTHDPAR